MMAILQNQQSGEKLHLRSLHVFGRNRAKCDTALDNRYASQLHASIRWNGNSWDVIDHSRNGTLIDAKAIPSNTKQAISLGQIICFGSGSAASWVVKSLDPPCPMLLSRQAHLPDIRLYGCQLLPDENLPIAAAYISHQGQWGLENSAGWRPFCEGELIHVGNTRWEFRSSPEVEATSDIASSRKSEAGAVLFNFTVSQNEEHISLRISDQSGSTDLGERIHHYSLLTLARQRREDALRGLSSDSQGWIETVQLSSMLGLDPSYLNIQIFRARNQISRAFPQENVASLIVERRRGEVRFGSFPFRIIRGSNLEGIFNPSHANGSAPRSA